MSVTPTQDTVLGVCASVIGLIITGFPVIYEGDDEPTAPRPNVDPAVDSYAAIEIQSDSSSWATAGENTTDTPSGAFVEQVRGEPIDGVLAIEIFGPGAYGRARALRTSHGRADVIRLLDAAGDYAIDNPSAVTRTPVLRSGTREPDASLTFDFKWVELETFDTEGVDTISTTVTVT